MLPKLHHRDAHCVVGEERVTVSLEAVSVSIEGGSDVGGRNL